MNEFHAQICDAQAQTNMLISAQTQFPSLCSLTQPILPTCVSFIQYTNCYYNQQSAINLQQDKQKTSNLDYLPLLIALASLALFWLLFLLLFCCFLCCPRLCPCCCPIIFASGRQKIFDASSAINTQSSSQKFISSRIQDFPGFSPTEFDTHNHVKSKIDQASIVNKNPMVKKYNYWLSFILS